MTWIDRNYFLFLFYRKLVKFWVGGDVVDTNLKLAVAVAVSSALQKTSSRRCFKFPVGFSSLGIPIRLLRLVCYEYRTLLCLIVSHLAILWICFLLLDPWNLSSYICRNARVFDKTMASMSIKWPETEINFRICFFLLFLRIRLTPPLKNERVVC